MRYLYCAWAAVALLFCTLECFRVLQSCSYRPQRGYVKIFFTWYYGALAITALFAFLWWKFFPHEAILCGTYTLVAIPLTFVRRKTPLRLTKRMLRMLCVNLLLLFVACYFALHWWVLVLPAFALVSWLICLPADMLINKKYMRLAQKKLQQCNIQIIAVTGSYGKTSTKDMLCSLLSGCIAPNGSCNTPLGIAKFINSTDLSQYKYLVLEFGARKKGDIAELCSLYKPRYGLVTGVCAQHLSTFKTVENVLSAKSELVQCLPKEGFCLLCDESVSSFACIGLCKKIRRMSVKTAQLSCTDKGLEFDAMQGTHCAHVRLPQITPHSAQTFCCCATVCLKLGQSFDQTIANASFIKQTPHRMEISHNGKFFVIDDAYNASIKGVAACCEALKHLCGAKIAISQGIVEGGNCKKQLNEQCGEMLGNVCDAVILLGKNAKFLKSGASKSSCKVVLQARNLQDAVTKTQPYLSQNCFLIFQNDLPDIVGL